MTTQRNSLYDFTGSFFIRPAAGCPSGLLFFNFNSSIGNIFTHNKDNLYVTGR
jgi:hypothetical protein